MKPIAAVAAAVLTLLPSMVAASTTAGSEAVSKDTLPANFKPPQVFRNHNLVHTISLEKNYAKETINVAIENISEEPQTDYYVPFTSDQMAKVGGIEVKDRKAAEVGGFAIEAVDYDVASDTQFYRIRLPKPLLPKEQQTLGISLFYLKAFRPLPAAIDQSDKQFLLYEFSAYWPSAYVTQRQKTEIKLPTATAANYTTISGTGDVKEFPQVGVSKLTYGPFAEVPAGAVSPASVRYEFTKPVTHVSELDRDVWVSHWGGNVAFEDRYTLYNRGANLSVLFNRVKWAQSQYFTPATFALKEIRFPLRTGSKDAYFTDVIGNVSTSRFRVDKKEALLEIKPRYPVFGGWKYPFTVGWNSDAKNFLRQAGGDKFVLNIPFLEGPKVAEGVEYGKIDLRVFLPEGATNVKFYTNIPETSIVEHKVDLQYTYLDTLGRTTLTIKARNLPDEFRDRELVITYDYSLLASLRKPFVVFASGFAIFLGLWVVSKVEVKFHTK